MNDLDRMAAKIKQYRDDPVLFVQEVMKTEPTQDQKNLLRSVRQHPRTSITSGHGTGKSSGAAFLTWWFLCCYPHSRVPITAPTGHQLDDILWSEIKKWHNHMEPYFALQFEVGADKVKNKKHPKTWYAVARTARKENPDALQGFHGDYLLFIVDEASGVDPKIFEPVEGALTGAGNRILIQGNPTQTSGYLFDSWNNDKSRWNRLRFNSETSPLVDADYPATMAQKYGQDSDIYRVRVLGLFPRAAINQLISQELVDEAMGRHLQPDAYQHAARVLGVDVARFGDDMTTWIHRQGLYAHSIKSWPSIDTMTLAGNIALEIKNHNLDMVFIEDVGIGAGVVDRLTQLGLGNKIASINPGKQAHDAEQFYNLRTEMWWRAKEWLESGGAIPPHDDLVRELTAPVYGFDSKNRIQLERKDDTKKRVGSPDFADALTLTHAFEVLPKVMARPQQAITDYNPMDGVPQQEQRVSGMDYNPI